MLLPTTNAMSHSISLKSHRPSPRIPNISGGCALSIEQSDAIKPLSHSHVPKTNEHHAKDNISV